MKDSEKLLDFGKHIPGARKEKAIYREYFFNISSPEDASVLSQKELDKLKRSVLIEYNPDEDFKNGTDPNLVYIRYKILSSLPASIKKNATKFDISQYIQYAKAIEPLLKLPLDSDFPNEYTRAYTHGTFKKESGKYVVSNDLCYNFGKIKKLSQFLRTNTDKDGKILYKLITTKRLQDALFLQGDEEIESYIIRNLIWRLKKNDSGQTVHFLDQKRLAKEKDYDPDNLPLSDKKYNSVLDYEKAVQDLAEIYKPKWPDHLKFLKGKSSPSSSKPKNETKPIYVKNPASSQKEISITNDDFMNRFGIPGVQFGNYVEQNKRVFHYNEAAEAFVTLTDILNISRKSIGFHGKLAVAFGARGRGHAAAHFEPLIEVINLTKFSGAGCFAHEWLHALDHFIAKELNLNTSMTTDSMDMPEEFRDLLDVIKHDDKGSFTEFYRKVKKSDYHSRPCELFAYCGETVILYKLEKAGMSCHYLVTETYGNFHPTKEFAEKLEPYFDAVFELAFSLGLFKSQTEEPDTWTSKHPEPLPLLTDLKIPFSIPTPNSKTEFACSLF